MTATKSKNKKNSMSPVSVVPVTAPVKGEMEDMLLEEDHSIKVRGRKPWVCPASAKSTRTKNPIRAIVDPIVANIKSGEERGDGKDVISLALGDPTAAGNLPPCPVALDSVSQALQSHSHAAGYVNACGLPEARKAIAKFHSAAGESSVIVANGCSGALEIALTALLDPGTILLVPKPGFPLYQVIAESHGAAVVHYNLLPDQNWECDLAHLEELVLEYGPDIRGLLINNPSNPTGGVFSKPHLESLFLFAEKHRLPVVADEVYGDLTFGLHKFHPAAEVAASLGREVPVITASGLGKQFLVPGWRVGWVVFQDNVHNSLREVEPGAKSLAQVILGASHLAQTAIAKLLDSSNHQIQEWKSHMRSMLEHQARFLTDQLGECPGLKVIEPQGAMYAIVKIDTSRFGKEIQTDIDFTSMLLKEENVFVLPGSAFGVANLFRVVFCAPDRVLEQAATRIHSFCERHCI